MNSVIVGITGGLATGKSTVAALFKQRGVKVVDADKIVHELFTNKGTCVQKIIKAFGPQIYGPQGIDRVALAKIVFNDLKKLRKLEQIVHPYVVRIIRKEIAAFRKQKNINMLVVEVPLLFEVGLNRLMDKIIVVYTNKKVQLMRARQLKGLSRADALKRIKAQMALQHKVRWADFVVDNSANLSDTQRQVRDIYRRLKIK